MAAGAGLEVCVAGFAAGAACLAAGVAVGAVRGAETAVEQVRFVLFGREAFEAFERALAT